MVPILRLYPHGDGKYTVAVRGTGADQDIPCATLIEARDVVTDKMHELCDLAMLAEQYEPEKPDDCLTPVGKEIEAMRSEIEALRAGLDTVVERQHRVRTWVSEIASKMPEYLPRKRKPGKPANTKPAKPVKRTLRKLAKVAKKPAKRVAKAKGKAA